MAENLTQTRETGTGSADAPNSPDITPDMQVHTPALLNIGQAIALVDGLKSENRDRSLRNARIQEKYNAERPYDPHRLSADGLSWKTNFSTKPLATLIDKVVPRFTTALRNMRYLTASKLPDRFPGASEKTEEFRRTITETCRQHESWEEILAEVAQENSLFGYCGVGWLDTSSWFPTFFRQDEFLAPSGTKHTSKSSQVVALKQKYLLHELFDLVRNRDAATAAGWTVNNVIKSLNASVPDDRRSTQSDPERIYADLSRENSVLSSFQGAKAVEVWHLLIAEVDGFITHVAFDTNSHDQLFWKGKQWANMSDAISFFSFQHGNGKLHGSKGIGRELYNMASVLDRSRNEVVDRLQLSGKVIVQCDERDIKRFRMSVVGNAILISSGYSIAQQTIDANVEPFFALDRFLTDLLDQVAGSTSPKAQEGERVTKAAVELMASREEERRDSVIERFLTQFARMMSTIQRRLCDSRTIDRDALEMQAKLLAVMTREELDYLAKQPAVATVQDYSEGERERIVLIAQEGRGNPLYNQHELEKRSLTAKMDVEFAEAVLLPVNDPTEQAENVRQQKLELLALMMGEDVEVSPRDNHPLHLQVLQESASPLIQAAADDHTVWPKLHALGKHAGDHIAAAEAQGNGKVVAESKKWATELANALNGLEQADADHAAQLGAEQQNIEAQGGPAAQVDETGQPVAPSAPQPSNKDRLVIPYKDMPPSVKRQAEAAAGFTPATESEEELARIALLSKPAPPAPAPAPEPAPEGPTLLEIVTALPYDKCPPSVQRQMEAKLGFVPASSDEAIAYARKMTKAETVPTKPAPASK